MTNQPAVDSELKRKFMHFSAGEWLFFAFIFLSFYLTSTVPMLANALNFMLNAALVILFFAACIGIIIFLAAPSTSHQQPDQDTPQK
jgi:hypothetical protein